MSDRLQRGRVALRAPVHGMGSSFGIITGDLHPLCAVLRDRHGSALLDKKKEQGYGGLRASPAVASPAGMALCC